VVEFRILEEGVKEEEVPLCLRLVVQAVVQCLGFCGRR